MKKALKLLWFLNKKGCFALGVLVGFLVALFCSSALEVHAEEMPDDSEEETQQATQQVIMYTTQNAGGSWNVDIDGTHYYIGTSDVRDVAAGYIQSDWHVNSNDKEVINVWLVLKRDSGSYYCSYEDWREKLNGNSVILSTTYSLNSSNFTRVNDSDFTKYIANVYIFSTRDECEAYLNGELDASAAINYEEIKNNTNLDYGSHDSNIPVPTKIYISNINSSNVTANVEYNPTEVENFKKEYNVDELYCEAEMEFFYQYLSNHYINNQKIPADLSGNNNTSGVTKYGLLFSTTSCGTLFNAINNQQLSEWYSILAYADSGSEFFYESVSDSLTFTGVPPDYSNLYYNDFSLFAFEHHMTFVCSQVKVRTYYVDANTGEKVYSDDLYVRRFVFDRVNEEYGSTYTRIEEDKEGNQNFIDSGFLDENGNESYYDDGYISVDNLLNYIEDGFGLTGSEGYVYMMQLFFRGVPYYIWDLIATAMAVSIIIILFKALR